MLIAVPLNSAMFALSCGLVELSCSRGATGSPGAGCQITERHVQHHYSAQNVCPPGALRYKAADSSWSRWVGWLVQSVMVSFRPDTGMFLFILITLINISLILDHSDQHNSDPS